jgi:hypothetical protein
LSDNNQQYTDYVLHGLVSVRLIDASQQDANAVTRQLGPIQGSFKGEPDITIRYVERLKISSSLRYLGLDDVGFTDDALLVMRSATGPRAQIPFEKIGKRCEIICERNIGKVPLLIPILNLTMLSKGVIPLHAAAFTYDGTGVLVTGWAKGGKTETLLGFMAHEAVYVGDEWVYISKDGRHMYGIPEPIRVWDSHLKDLPGFRKRISGRGRARLNLLTVLIKLTEGVMNLTCDPAVVRESRLLKLVRRQHYVQLPPRDLFATPLGPAVGCPDKIFFVLSAETSEVTVEEIEASEVIRRMLFSLRFERADFISHYLKYRFAFPDAVNHFIEQAEELEREILTSALAGKPSYVVYHPYPAPIPALFDAISPYLAQIVHGKTKSAIGNRQSAMESPCYQSR